MPVKRANRDRLGSAIMISSARQSTGDGKGSGISAKSRPPVPRRSAMARPRPRPSEPVRTGSLAGGEMLKVGAGHPRRELQQVADPGVGDGVHDLAALAFCAHEPAPPKAGQVVRHPALRHIELFDQLGHGVRPRQQQLDDGDPGRVAQSPEEAGVRRGDQLLVLRREARVIMRCSTHIPILRKPGQALLNRHRTVTLATAAPTRSRRFSPHNRQSCCERCRAGVA